MLVRLILRLIKEFIIGSHLRIGSSDLRKVERSFTENGKTIFFHTTRVAVQKPNFVPTFFFQDHFGFKL